MIAMFLSSTTLRLRAGWGLLASTTTAGAGRGAGAGAGTGRGAGAGSGAGAAPEQTLAHPLKL